MLRPAALRPTALAALTALAPWLALGCDSTPARRGVCARADAPEGCDAPCSPLLPCPAGTYCGASDVCTADCAAGVPCAAGLTCGSEGRCVSADAGDTDAGGTDAGFVGIDAGPPIDAPEGDAACASVSLETTRATPNVILIVDRSGSMGMESFPAGSTTTRWDALRTALIDPSAGLVRALASSVRFGFVTYRELGGIPSCPDLSAIPALIDNADTISDAYSVYTPGGATPTGATITNVLGMLPSLVTATEEPTIFVLATDGEPNTCADTTDEVTGRAESVAAVEAAFAAGVRTYVLSVGTDVSTAHLQDVANAGLGRGPSDPPAEYWVATDATGLGAALGSIIGSVASCDIELVGRIDPSMACAGEVRLSGRPLACGDADGWQVVDATHIRLAGAACDELQSRGGAVDARFPCEVVVF